ncbi:MAG: response regulator [Deltaproteobacteria bacterium]|nr:response regulator [Deltaproteobacteria bacterium]
MAKILLVDDDRDFLEIAAKLLAFAKIDVVLCTSAMEALEQARELEFDVVITDANMQPHSGYDLIRSIKQIPTYDLIPIAMITGRREKRDVERALAVGAQDYIVKPIDPERFIKKVTELISQSEQARKAARFGEVQMEEVAKCSVAIVISGISESGVLLDSDHKLLEGTVLNLDAEIFDRIGIPRPQAKVKSCTPGSVEKTFEIRASFHALDDRSLGKVRQFIQAKAAQSKKGTKAA